MEDNPVTLLTTNKWTSLTGYEKVACLVIASLSIGLALFHLFGAFFSGLLPYAQRVTCFSLLCVIALLLKPLKRKSWRDTPIHAFFLIDSLLILMIVVPTIYVFINYTWWTEQMAAKAPPFVIILGTGYIIATVELIRRYLGLSVTIIVVFFLIQGLISDHLPSLLYGPPISWKMLIEIIFVADHGIFSLPIDLVASFLVVLILFLSIIQVTGGGDWFLKLAMTLVGRYDGGPAKIAVIGSGLLGMIEGSPVTNVVGTGTFTIPLMKRIGMPGHLAGAIEAVASSGAMIMPPVMGLTAFMMADYVGIPYFKVCLAAAMPAFLYYFAAFMRVHFEIKKLGLGKTPDEILAGLKLKEVLKEGFFFLTPLIIFVYFLIQQYGLAKCAAYAFLTTLILCIIKPKDRLTSEKLLLSFYEGTKSAIPVAIACGAAGIIIGTFYASGVGDRLLETVINISKGNLAIASILIAGVSLLLGMGMPAIPVYVTLALTAAPALVHLGANRFAAHFFCFYWGIISNITPPVALAAYVAAGIAQAPVMKTGWTAYNIGLPLVIIMLMLPSTPELIGVGPLHKIIITFLSGIACSLAISAAFAGYFTKPLRWGSRILLFVIGMTFLVPNIQTRLLGTVATAAILATMALTRRTEILK